MKSFLLTISFFFVIITNVFANTLDTYISINRFYQIETKQHYVEVSYMVPAVLVNFIQNNNGKFQAKLKTSIQLFKKTELVSSKTYILQSAQLNSLNEFSANFTDVVRLFAPMNDTLTLSIKIEDVNKADLNYTTEVAIFIPENKEVFLSDIMLISSAEKTLEQTPFSRNNMKIIPKFINYYPTENDKIQFYAEFYQTKNLENYFVRYLLTDEIGVYIDGYASYKRIEKKSYQAIISGFDISTLPSGNYYLFMELKDANNKVVEIKRTFFQRNNKNANVVENIHTQKDELNVITNNFAKKYDLANIRHHIQALAPLATQFEMATIESFKASDDVEQMQNYFYSFWSERNSKDPEAEWMAYAKKLQYVEKTFTNANKRGYETPMGIVYLMYGKPSDERFNGRNKTGGEFWVWNYERIKNQGNVYFVFVNRDNITDDFVLVHTSLKGQIYDKNWAKYLKSNF